MMFSEYSSDHGCNGTVVHDSERKREREHENEKKEKNIKKGIEKKNITRVRA